MIRGVSKALSIALVVFVLQTFASAEDEVEWKTYRGAWFKIDYPADFTVRPSLKSTSAKGFDSVFFVSPDESVEFYVFSPQWNGEPSDIQINPKTERVVSEKTEDLPDTDQKMGTKSVRRYTIEAADKSYLRSYVDTQNKDVNYRFVIGLKYPHMGVYRAYREKYQEFLKSLKQYAD